MSTGKADANAITISNGKSPDRSKNMSVYSQGQSLPIQFSNVGSHQASMQGIANTRSPYLGMPVNNSHQGAPANMKKRGDKADGGHRKKESMLANATYKNAILN